MSKEEIQILCQIQKLWKTKMKNKWINKWIKFQLIIYAVFESMLIPEDNVKQNPKEFYRNKHQKTCSLQLCYKLVCGDKKVSKSFKSYFGEYWFTILLII